MLSASLSALSSPSKYATVAPSSFSVGTTVIWSTEFATLAVYDVVVALNAGLSVMSVAVPLSSQVRSRAPRLASVEAARVTTTV